MAAPSAGLPPVTAPKAAPPPAPIAPPLKARCWRGVMLAHPAVARAATTTRSASARVIRSLLSILRLPTRLGVSRQPVCQDGDICQRARAAGPPSADLSADDFEGSSRVP